jgi:hypothetical protein
MLMFLPMSLANAEGWADTPPTTVPVPVEVTVVPAEAGSLSAAAADVAGRSRLTIKQRRSMGITIPSVIRQVIALNKANELSGKDSGLVAIAVCNGLVTDNPMAFSDPQLDWEAVMEWIEFIVKIVMAIMMLS